MLIALDIGINHVTIGGFDGDDIRFVAAIAADERQTGEQYACALKNVFALYGAAAMIDGLIDRYAEALGQTPTVLLTGGMAQTVRPYLRTRTIHEPLLALRGLADIWYKNHGSDRKAN